MFLFLFCFVLFFCFTGVHFLVPSLPTITCSFQGLVCSYVFRDNPHVTKRVHTFHTYGMHTRDCQQLVYPIAKLHFVENPIEVVLDNHFQRYEQVTGCKTNRKLRVLFPLAVSQNQYFQLSTDLANHITWQF